MLLSLLALSVKMTVLPGPICAAREPGRREDIGLDIVIRVRSKRSDMLVRGRRATEHAGEIRAGVVARVVEQLLRRQQDVVQVPSDAGRAVPDAAVELQRHTCARDSDPQEYYTGPGSTFHMDL